MMPALEGFGAWFTENQGTIQTWATIVGVALLPLFARIAVSAAVSAAAQVTAWATAGGAAIKAAAVYVASGYIVLGRFVALAVQASVSAVATSAAWVAAQVRTVAAWVAMAAAAVANGIRIAAVWTAQVVAAAASGAAAFVVQTARVVGGWALMGAQSLIHAARMAAAWFIALGPVGWVIAAVIGLVAVIIANWDKVVQFTTTAWAAVTTFLSQVWTNVVNGITGFIQTAIGWFLKFHPLGLIISNWSTIVSFFAGIWSNVTGGIAGFVDGAVGFFRDLPGKILAALGNVGQILWDAGSGIINGLLEGLQSAWKGVTDFVGGIANWIAENKGPLPYDRRLLVPAGNAIMDGLDKGLRDKMGALKGTLQSVTGMIAGGIQPELNVSGAYSGSGAYTAAVPPTGGGKGLPQVSITVYEADNADATAQRVWGKVQTKLQEQGVTVDRD
jgi:hypothetical protein